MNYNIIYTQSLLFCLFILVILFYFNLKRRNDISTSHIILYVIAITNTIIEIAFLYINNNTFLIPLNYLINIIYLSCYALFGFFWLDFCNNYYNFKIWDTLKQKLIFFFPIFIEIIFIVFSFTNKLIFYIDNNGVYTRGNMFFITYIPYAYILIASIFSIINSIKANLISRKKTLLKFAIFPIPVALITIVQIMLPPGALPITEFALCILFLIIYVALLESKITKDSLTRLSNRYVMEDILNKKMSRDEKFYVILGDLDNFKTINDTYGHLEGDKALIIVANTLYEVGLDNDTKAIRMGGDEFLLIVNDNSRLKVLSIIKQIDRKLEIASKKEKYNIAMSLGYAKWEENMTMSELLSKADHEMYAIKKKKKLSR